MEKGQRVQIRIEDMTSEGQGLGRSDGLAVFVKGAVVGDVVLAELTKVKKNYAFAKMAELLEPSPDRVEAQCEYSGLCGGCPYSRISYEGQLALKEKQVRDKLTRLGGLKEPLLRPIIGMDEPFRYRNKASMPVWTGGVITRKGGIVENLGEPVVGFYKARSHEVVDCYDCLIQSEPAMAAAEALRRFMESDHITAYDPKWEKGLMRHLIVKTAFGTGEVMVILVINGKGIPNAQKLVEMLDDYIYSLPPREDGIEYSLESVVVSVCKGKNGAMPGSVMGEELITIAGKPVIREEVGGLSFEISPLSFYQVNPAQMERLYAKALEYADLSGGETVLDLYCGVGTIGLFAARKMEEAYRAGHGGALDYDKAGRVIGIESVRGAVLDANRNAVINHIVNARYVCGRAEEELPKLIRQSKAPEDFDRAERDSRDGGKGQNDGKDQNDSRVQTGDGGRNAGKVQPGEGGQMGCKVRDGGKVRNDGRVQLGEGGQNDGKVQPGQEEQNAGKVQHDSIDEGLRIDHADVVFLDPPRAGCDEQLLQAVVSIQPEKIVYVSCDPATLARDVKYLTGNGYEFVEGTPVDMFPWSVHTECCVKLVRAEK